MFLNAVLSVGLEVEDGLNSDQDHNSLIMTFLASTNYTEEWTHPYNLVCRLQILNQLQVAV